MGNVEVIGEEELERVFSRCQLERRFRLPLPEMAVVIGARDGQIDWREFGVDDEMMVSRPALLDARWRDSHSSQTEAHDHRRRQCFSALGRDEVDPDIRGAVRAG